MMTFQQILTRLLDKARCFFGHHLYAPLYEVRQWNASNGRYLYKEFRYECACCGQKTRWHRWRYFEKFAKKHKPTWTNSRQFLKIA
jgi:hypothetical protein